MSIQIRYSIYRERARAISAIDDEIAIRSLASACSEAVNRGDLDGMIEFYAADGVLVPFGGDEYRGRDATRFFGLYQDRVVCTGEGWRFAERRLDATFPGRTTITGKPYARPSYGEPLWP